jgi:hypothetical protein
VGYVLPLRIARGKIFDEELRVVADHRQDVVEIVSHSPCELPDRLHLLSLEQLLLQQLGLRDVPIDRDDGTEIRFGEMVVHGHLDPPYGPVFVHHAGLGLHTLASKHPRQHGLELRHFLGMYQIEAVASDQLLRPIPEHALHRRADVEDLSVRIGETDHVAHVDYQRPEAGLVAAKLLCALTLIRHGPLRYLLLPP